MGKAYLIDSNVFRKYIDGELSEKGKILVRDLINSNNIQISFINRIELFSWNSIGFTSKLIKEFVILAYEFPLTEDFILKTIEIRKNVKIKLPDAIIAATAIINNLILLSVMTRISGKCPI